MEKLTSHDQHTYDAIFRHPVSGNIEWHAITALLNHLGEVVDGTNGKMKIHRNGQTITLHAKGKDAELEEIEQIRRFLLETETPSEEAVGSADFLLVLDHSEARIYHSEEKDSKPTHIEPYDPHGWDKHVHDTHGYAPPHTAVLHHEFYEKIADALNDAKRIVVFGDGSGSSNEPDLMLDDLKRTHIDVGERLLANECLDLSHMSEGEVLAKARETFAAAASLI